MASPVRFMKIPDPEAEQLSEVKEVHAWNTMMSPVVQ